MSRPVLRTRENSEGVKRIIAKIRERRNQISTLSHCIHALQESWKRMDTHEPLTQQGIERYILHNLENYSFWLGLQESERTKGGWNLQRVRDNTCERFDQYLTVIGYKPAERQEIFTELAHYNPAIRTPQDTIGELQ